MSRLTPLVIVNIVLFVLFVTQLSFSAEDKESAPQGSYNYSQQTEGKRTSGSYLYLDASGSLQKKVPGVGSGLATMLDKLISITGGSESNIRQIISYTPLLLPDLYKVFVTL